MSFKIVKTSKTRVDTLQSYGNGRPKSDPGEPELEREEVALEESSVGEAFEEIFGDAGEEVKPGEVNVPKPHVREDDEPDDTPIEDEPPKRKYSGQMVEEGVNPSKSSEGENADLDDLISAAMEGIPSDETQPAEEKKRSTSTPSKEDEGVDNADFGGFISIIRDDNEPPPPPVEDKDDDDDKPRDIPLDRQSGRDDESSRKSWSPGKSSSRITTTITTYSFSSKFVPSIPASFYKDLQMRLEDLIFKFECLDNEYAALQKISNKVYIETMDVKKIFSNEN